MYATAISCECCYYNGVCRKLDLREKACSSWEGDGALVVMDEVQLLSFKIFETMEGYMESQGILVIQDEVPL